MSHIVPGFDKTGMVHLGDQQQDTEDKAAISIIEFYHPGPSADHGGEGG